MLHVGLCVTCRPVCYVIVVTFQRESIGQCDSKCCDGAGGGGRGVIEIKQ